MPAGVVGGSHGTQAQAHGAGTGKPPGRPGASSEAVKRTPRDPSEDQLHSAVAEFLEWALANQPVVWAHYPAGGYLLSKAARGRLTRYGMKPGFPDLLFWWAGKCLGIELKTGIGRLSGEQRRMHSLLWQAGTQCEVARSLGEVQAALRKHRVPMNPIKLTIGDDGALGTRTVIPSPNQAATSSTA